ncbi:MAG: hypothetical protein NTW21_43980 [Verrucomicrobia bacterium]|nr:hypothetical protein [Verrucomicrobiota bacterium]
MKITRKKKFGILALAFAAASASSAFGTTIALSGGAYQNGSGGEFTASVSKETNDYDAYIGTYSSLTATNTSTTNNFQTFCIEYNEHFYWAPATYTSAVSSAAIRGGVPGGEDPVSVGTGWLYSQFAQGLLKDNLGNNYFTTGSRYTNAGDLQNAIWWLEGEIGGNLSGNKYIMAAAAALGVSSTVPKTSPLEGGTGLAADSLNGRNAAWFGVHALNLGPFEGNPAVSQDQLIYQKTGNQIPDGGATLLLLGLSLSGMGALQRRMRRTA